jgi:hypothetical protein
MFLLGNPGVNRGKLGVTGNWDSGSLDNSLKLFLQEPASIWLERKIRFLYGGHQYEARENLVFRSRSVWSVVSFFPKNIIFKFVYLTSI